MGGTYGPDDGHFDAYAMLMGYKAKARSLGAEYLSTMTSRKYHNPPGAGHRRQTGLTENPYRQLVDQLCRRLGCPGGCKLQASSCRSFRSNARSSRWTRPSSRKRPLPLTVLPSGLYFRTETGGLILLGKSMDEDPVGFDFAWDDKRFMEILWPELAEFVPAFDRLKLVRGWAGLYAVNTLDGNAILGEWPELSGFF